MGAVYSRIDRAFVDFEKQPDSWRVCLEMMTLTQECLAVITV